MGLGQQEMVILVEFFMGWTMEIAASHSQAWLTQNNASNGFALKSIEAMKYCLSDFSEERNSLDLSLNSFAVNLVVIVCGCSQY